MKEIDLYITVSKNHNISKKYYKINNENYK